MAELLIRKQLKEPFLEQAIQDTNFFNGRLLTAEALSVLQRASHQRVELLGQAAGSGVVSGLEVTLSSDGSDGKPPVLAVTKGLAINRLGQPTLLPLDGEVALAKDKPDQIPAAGFFNVCLPYQQNGQPLPGKGAYIFAIRPFVDAKGYAPRRGFGQAAKVEGCDRDTLVEGVQFRLVGLDINQVTTLSTQTRQELAALLAQVDTPGPAGQAALNKLRNWLAHACFGSEELAGFIADPFSRPAGNSPYDSYGAIDALRGSGLIDDCDVPLALVCWTVSGVKFVDMWSARRRLVRLNGPDGWPLPTAERHAAEREAAFNQFQDQVQGLFQSNLSNFGLSSIRALDYFRYLPAVGLVPIRKGGARGFEFLNFISGLTIRDRDILGGLTFPDRFYIEGAQVENLMQESLTYPPIDLGKGELVWFYLVRQNIQAIDNSSSAVPPAYTIFSSGHMRFRGDGRFDLSHYDYSNFASLTNG